MNLYCPECGSDAKFYHCYDGCAATEHIVTCLNCRTTYNTSISLWFYDELIRDPVRPNRIAPPRSG